jgi:hypothetical protein
VPPLPSTLTEGRFGLRGPSEHVLVDQMSGERLLVRPFGVR